MSVQRYLVTPDGLREDDSGGVVSHFDYQAIEARVRELERELKGARGGLKAAKVHLAGERAQHERTRNSLLHKAIELRELRRAIATDHGPELYKPIGDKDGIRVNVVAPAVRVIERTECGTPREIMAGLPVSSPHEAHRLQLGSPVRVKRAAIDGVVVACTYGLDCLPRWTVECWRGDALERMRFECRSDELKVTGEPVA